MTIEFTENRIFYAMWFVEPNHKRPLVEQVDLMGAMWQENPAGDFCFKWRWRYYKEETAWGDKDVKNWYEAELPASSTMNEAYEMMDINCVVHVMKHYRNDKYPPGPLRDLQALIQSVPEDGYDNDEEMEKHAERMARIIPEINVRWFVQKCPYIDFTMMGGLMGMDAADILIQKPYMQGSKEKIRPGESEDETLNRAITKMRIKENARNN